MAKMNAKRALPLTEAEASRISGWLEHAARPEDFRPRKVGRKPLGDDHTSPRIQVRVPSRLYRAVNKRAHDEGTTVSALVRRLLEGYADSA